jgi:ABC-2 type transport system permease protein
VIALVRTEMVKAVRRTRTLVIALGLVGLPTLIVVAIHARGDRPRGEEGGIGLFRLAQQSGLLVPAAVLSVTSAFLLVVVAGTFAGDSVAGDAAWGNLRYLLMRPVPRGRLLVAKAFAAGVLIWASTVVVSLAALVGGVALFGAHALNFTAAAANGAGGIGPGAIGLLRGFSQSESTILSHVAVATAYVAFGYTALLALGTLFSTLTDSAAGAIGATVGVYIVSEILDGISQLGQLRYGFPTHYIDAWQSMFTQNRYSHDMIAGIVVQVAYFVVFGAIAVVWFRRKDIRS